jgi:DNA-binding Xre family transcriptional regulator
MIINKAKSLAAQRGLSLYRIAKDAQLSYPAVYNFFHDVSMRYDRRVLDRICQVLACQVSDLLEHVPNAEKKRNARAAAPRAKRNAASRSNSAK